MRFNRVFLKPQGMFSSTIFYLRRGELYSKVEKPHLDRYEMWLDYREKGLCKWI